MIVLEYFKDVCFKSVLIILLLSLYFVMLGGLMHLMSNFLRKKFADVFGLKTYIYLTAPGGVVHESGHALFCLVFLHKILEMKLFSPDLYVIEKVVNLGGFVIMQISSILMFIFLFSILFGFFAALRKRRTA